MCLNIDINMTTKTITITEDAYNSLKVLKREYESFSHFFVRLSKEHSVADKFFGILAGENVHQTRERLRKVRTELSDDFKRREDALSRHQRRH